MADIQTPEKGSHSKHGKGKVRSKKMSTRVDFTPMVDLAFLLISFFMLTTTLNKPVAMELNMPKKDDNVKQDVRASQVINLLLDKDDKIWYYDGQVVYDMKTTDYSEEGIRKVIYDKQKDVLKQFNDPEKRPMIAIIKMTDGATYKNMVDILDEMDITNTKVYAIQDIAPLELEAIANGGKLEPTAVEGGN